MRIDKVPRRELEAYANGRPTSDTPATAHLLPCPCCGARASFCRVDEGGDNFAGEYIECTGCGITTALRFPCMEGAKPLLAETWNRRTPAQTPQDASLVAD